MLTNTGSTGGFGIPSEFWEYLREAIKLRLKKARQGMVGSKGSSPSRQAAVSNPEEAKYRQDTLDLKRAELAQNKELNLARMQYDKDNLSYLREQAAKKEDTDDTVSLYDLYKFAGYNQNRNKEAIPTPAAATDPASRIPEDMRNQNWLPSQAIEEPIKEEEEEKSLW